MLHQRKAIKVGECMGEPSFYQVRSWTPLSYLGVVLGCLWSSWSVTRASALFYVSFGFVSRSDVCSGCSGQW